MPRRGACNHRKRPHFAGGNGAGSRYRPREWDTQAGGGGDCHARGPAAPSPEACSTEAYARPPLRHGRWPRPRPPQNAAALFCAAGRTFLLFSAGKRGSSFVISMDIFVVWKFLRLFDGFLRLLKGVLRLSRSFLLLFGAALRLFDDFLRLLRRVLRSFGGVRKRPRAARENGARTVIAGMGKHERRRQPFVSGALAHLAGFEPTACRLGGGRSILLSYKCMCGNVHYTVFPRACQAKAHEIGARRTK